jgi:predicted dehydrogenase
VIGVGQIGCGRIGMGHAYALRLLAQDGSARPVVAADPSAEAAAEIARICPFERTTTDPASVIADPEVDAVLIASPTTTHPRLVRDALGAGKHVLCEKPLATDFPTVRDLCALAAAGAPVTQVGFHSRWHPIWLELRDLLGRGDLGAPMAYSLRDDQFWPTGDVVPGHSSWRSDRAQAGGGALLEHSIHSADLVTWVFGPVTRVYAQTRRRFGYDVEDVAVCTIEHASGVVGALTTVFNGVRGREERRFEVFCEHASVEATSDFLVGAPEDGLSVQRPDEPADRADVEALRERHFDAMGLPRRDFVVYLYPAARAWLGAIALGRPASPGFADALAAHALVEAAYRSAATGAPVELAALD